MHQDHIKNAAYEGNLDGARNIIKAARCLNKEEAV
jgi:hypothetical protein